MHIARFTLGRWHKRAEFVAEVERLRVEIAEAVKAEGIANRQNRIDAYNERWRLMRQVISERAEELDMAAVPGGKTGLLVRTYKQIGRGEDVRLISEYAVDTGLLKELRTLEQQAAEDLGQWTRKGELTGKDGEPLEFTLVLDRTGDHDDGDA